jgi:predicted peroxiredoxin
VGQEIKQGSEQPRVDFPQPQFQGQKVESRIHKDFRGMCLSAGFFGSGKTLFHLAGERAENICFIDLEMKGRNHAEALGITNYFSPPEEAAEVVGDAYKPIHLFQRVTQILSSLPAGRFTWVLLDGVKILQEGLAAEVERSPQSYGVKTANAEKGRYGGVYPGVGVIFTKYYAMCRAKGVQVLGLTSELKAKWGNEGPILNKFEIAGVSALNKYSILSVLTVPGYPENLGAPSGLVLKESLARVEGGRIVRRLPVKLPKATMEEVYRYLDEPCDWGNPKPQEVPTPEEMEPYSSFVGKEQMGLLRAYLEAARAGAIKVETEDTEDDMG